MTYMNLTIKLFKKKIKMLIKKLKKQKSKTMKKAFEVDVFDIIIVFIIIFKKNMFTKYIDYKFYRIQITVNEKYI